jgi:hypothetical protein
VSRGLRAEKPQDAAKEGLRAEIAVSWAEHEAAGIYSGGTINGKAASWADHRAAGNEAHKAIGGEKETLGKTNIVARPSTAC